MILILFWLEFLAQRCLSCRSLLEMDGTCTTPCTIKMRPRYRFLGTRIIDLLVNLTRTSSRQLVYASSVHVRDSLLS
jgi:hypothetical protein